MRIAAILIGLAALSAACAARAAEGDTIKVLVLGTYHMGNPGLDIANVKSEDVTTPERQAELEDVARRLARFSPTKIALESRPARDDFKSERYPAFTPADLRQARDERIQIGYRLAHDLGHKDVYTVDEQSDEIVYFPFGAVREFADASGRAAELDQMIADIQARVEAFGDSQREKSIRELLAVQNEPAAVFEDHSAFYYGLMTFSGPQRQPGADLNAYWYMRNAKIFAKLMQVAEPGDRILLIYGAGHNYWLRHFAATTPGYELVEANDYLLDR